MKIFTSIKWKLLAFSTLLVIMPTIIVGLLTYHTFYNETFRNAEESLKLIAHDWRDITEAYYQQVEHFKSEAMRLGQAKMDVQKRAEAFEEKLKNDLLEKIGEQKIYNKGYIWVASTRGKYLVSKDRRRDGENIFYTKDEAGVMFIKEMVENAQKLKGDAVLVRYYSWQNKGEAAALPKLSAVTYFPQWGWIIGASAYRVDYQRGLSSIRNSILFISLFSIVIGASVAYILAAFISKPICIMNEMATGAVNGDLSIKIPDVYDKRNDEIGHLAHSFNAMIMRLKTKIDELVQANNRLTLEAEVRQEAEDKLCELQDEIINISRKAGMSEVATGVIHNVGNVLTSVTISANLMEDELYKMKVESVGQVAELLKLHEHNLEAFFTQDEIGKDLVEFFELLGNNMEKNQTELLQELKHVKQNIEHIRIVIQTQQEYARIAEMKQSISIHHIIEDAIRIDELALKKRNIDIVREYCDLPDVLTEKHKLLQVLTNLIKNTRHAFDSMTDGAKKLVIKTALSDGMVVIQVKDNGVGIPPDIMTDIFGYGFTTHEDGHGFGLHSAAIAAQELGGRLNAESDGVGKGAVFTLEIPVS